MEERIFAESMVLRLSWLMHCSLSESGLWKDKSEALARVARLGGQERAEIYGAFARGNQSTPEEKEIILERYGIAELKDIIGPLICDGVKTLTFPRKSPWIREWVKDAIGQCMRREISWEASDGSKREIVFDTVDGIRRGWYKIHHDPESVDGDEYLLIKENQALQIH